MKINPVTIMKCTLIASLLTGCTIIPPVKPEVELLSPGGNLSPTSSDQIRVLLFNTTSPVWAVPNSGMDVWIDGKGVTRLDTGQYAEIFVSKGDHILKVLHQDVLDFYTDFNISVNSESRFIEICYTKGETNKARVLVELPEAFDESFTALNAPQASYLGLRDKPFFNKRLHAEMYENKAAICAW